MTAEAGAVDPAAAVAELLARPERAAAHLEPAAWDAVNRQLVAKAIGELAHELVLAPVLVRDADVTGGGGEYVLVADAPGVTYRFRARLLQLEHWLVDPASLRRLVAGRAAAGGAGPGEAPIEAPIETPIDALRFVVDLRDRLAIPSEALPAYLEELAATLGAAAHARARGGLPAAELALADAQTVEAAMTAGHPIFLANAGRAGFSALDYPRYAPEAAAPVPLLWLAARRERADFGCTRDLSYEALLADELGPEALAAFGRALAARGSSLDEVRLIPVHPWQWENRLAQLYAPDLARGDLALLGPGPGRHRAQQSIRTFLDLARPAARYVKTSLSITNMGFSRGLSPRLAARGPAVNDWVAALVAGDPYLAACRFAVLREVAFVGVRHRYYEAASARRSDSYKELLAALWREAPAARLRPGQRAMTMAALLHVDAAGDALLPALIRASGLPAAEWVRRYLRCYLAPLAHCLFAHRLVFTPHGENAILVLEDHAPAGLFLKDLCEDIGVLNPEAPLPAEVAHLALRVPEETLTLSIFIEVFDGVLRFVAALLDDRGVLPEAQLWALVAECLHAYERAHPAAAAAHRRHDLFAPRFVRSCLNRLQLRDHRMMVDLNAADPVASLQFVGTLANPIAALRPAAPATAGGRP